MTKIGRRLSFMKAVGESIHIIFGFIGEAGLFLGSIVTKTALFQKVTSWDEVFCVHFDTANSDYILAYSCPCLVLVD